MQPTRLNKYISDTGFCSRREADKLIEQGRVTVNGKYPDAGTIVTEKDKVRIDDELIRSKEQDTVFLVFNKPSGIAATTDLTVRNNVIHALNYPIPLQPIGYLDRDSEGIMFLTNNTELANKMTKYDTQYEKEYIVTVNKTVTPGFLSKIAERHGANPGADSARTNFVAKEGTSRFRIVLEPGMSHHIKKMCEELGYEVVHLQRIRVQDFSATKLPVRSWRVLSKDEVDSLKKIVAGRSERPATATKYRQPGYRRPGAAAGGRPYRPGAAGADKGGKAAGARPAKAVGPVAKKSAGKKTDAPARKSAPASAGRKPGGSKAAPKRGR